MHEPMRKRPLASFLNTLLNDARPLVIDDRAEMSEAQDADIIARPPVRTKTHSQRRRGVRTGLTENYFAIPDKTSNS